MARQGADALRRCTAVKIIFAVALALVAPPPPVAAALPLGYDYYEVGDVGAATAGQRSPALLLVGGGEWDIGAFRWFVGRAGHGHIVVLRASGAGEAGEEIYRQIGGAASVQTIVFHDRAAASDARVLDILDHADGIFIAGGDQSNYVRYWKGTPVAQALDAHVRRGRPLGGTSAGLAILGGTGYGAMDGGSVDSTTALADPGGAAVTLVSDFLHMPRLAHIVTDTHFTKRNRLGRLIAFLAQARQRDRGAVGLGIDEGAALCVEADGLARLHTPPGGFAWLVEPTGPAHLTRGAPLDWGAVRITGIGTDSVLNLATLRITRPAFAGVARVAGGKLTDVPEPPRRQEPPISAS
jgi:cyanophycinase